MSAKNARRPKRKKSDLQQQINNIRRATAAVGQVLVHFGAGTGMKPQIFASPNEITHFVRLLLRNTIKNHDILRWNRDAAIRDTVCQAAYKHGMLARKAAGGRRLTARIIEASLKRAKKDCPAGAGGGIMCVD